MYQMQMKEKGGILFVDVKTMKNLDNCVLFLYMFRFKDGKYEDEPNVTQEISKYFLSQDGGEYNFSFPVPQKCKVKCVICEDDQVLVSKETICGERQTVNISREPAKGGTLFKVKADCDISKDLIYYKSEKSGVRFFLPRNIVNGEIMTFIIQSKTCNPRFEVREDVAKCFNVIG